MNRRTFNRTALVALAGAALWPAPPAARATQPSASAPQGAGGTVETITRTEAQWRALLTDEQYEVLREKGTERAFSGRYDKFYEPGAYSCAGCGLDLFSSRAKFNSGTGWPSFYEPSDPAHVRLVDDFGFFMRRTEVRCARCDGHLGHVFEDGPPPTGLRYCMNSVALTFRPDPQPNGGDQAPPGHKPPEGRDG
jgi:peptide-methionine (R)-S-oxide reductase